MKISSLIAMLEEREIARVVGIPHDEARMRFPLQSNTVTNFDEFSEILADYFNHHYAACLSGGGFSTSQAASRAKGVIENEYRRKGGDIVIAYNDAHDGTNGVGDLPYVYCKKRLALPKLVTKTPFLALVAAT